VESLPVLVPEEGIGKEKAGKQEQFGKYEQPHAKA
jgi:hypothetical protein